MPDRSSEIRRRVTLEDLLRVKRAERPPPEFWTAFEGELRQRQLAALVERKSWWQEAVSLAHWRALRLPFGGLAVLALTLLSLHRYGPASAPAPRTAEAPAAEAAVAATAVTPPAQPEIVALARPAEVLAPAAAPVAPSRQEEPAAPAAGAASAGAREAAGIIPLLGDGALGRLAAADGTPASVDLASVPMVVEPGLAAPAAPALGFEERAMPEMRRRPTAEMLPTAAAAAVPRRARLLAVLDSAGASVLPEPSTAEQVRRSVARYLNQDDETRSMSRLGTAAAGVSLVRF